MVVYRLGIYGLLSDFTQPAQGKQAMTLEFRSLITFVSIWQKQISGWMFVLNKIMNTSTLSKTVNWTGKKNKASAIRSCSMPRLLTLPSAGCQSINRSKPFVMHKGFFLSIYSYPQTVNNSPTFLWKRFSSFSKISFQSKFIGFTIEMLLKSLSNQALSQILLSYNS